jgi:3-hydroxyacyl-CoA dehydrogenase
MSDLVTLSKSGTVAIVEINNPPVNALGQAVREGLLEAVKQAEADPEVTAIVIIGVGRTFPAGADIKEFGRPMQDPHLPDVIDEIESCTKPVVAALHGTALGGGFEVALGSHYRIALSDARVGLPEIHLGLIPGAGGTQRVPRLCGAEMALDIMFKGTPISAQTAHAAGLIDRFVEVDLLDAALTYAGELTQVRRTREETRGLADEPAYRTALAKAEKTATTRMRGQIAPLQIIACVKAALEQPFAEGRLYERDCFFDCLASEQSKGMIHAFFAERASAKVPESGRAQSRPLNSLGVVGGGTMGTGITVAALNSGLPVTMIERDDNSLKRGRANVQRVYDRLLAKGRITADHKAKIMSLYTGSTDYADLSDADMVIEAVFERLDMKREVFTQLDKVMKPSAVLASNTSYIDIDHISSATSRPDQVLGLHFFSPANIMKLLEIVVPKSVADDVVATGFAFAKRLGKVPVRAGNSAGFIGNRILGKYGMCAAHMMEDGATPYEIDAAIYAFGYPMGIHAMYDLAGLDIGWDNRKAAAATRNPAEREVQISDRICELGWFGQKTERGFYLYPQGARIGTPDPEVLTIIEAERARKGITPRSFSGDEIMERYMAAMVNEACEVLCEAVALKPSDIDVTFVCGYGFPRFRGGPMKYADGYGLSKMLDNIRTYKTEDPVFWKPSPLLVDLVAAGKTFDDLNKG